MDISNIWESLSEERGGAIIYLIMDGVGGLPHPDTGKTELQTANTPNLDRLAKQSICGLLEMKGESFNEKENHSQHQAGRQKNSCKG